MERKVIEVLDDAELVPLAAVLDETRIERTYLLQMVDAGVVSPRGASVEQWTFVRRDLRRLRSAQRLIDDLEVNIPGAALILDLIEERDALLQRMRSGSEW